MRNPLSSQHCWIQYSVLAMGTLSIAWAAISGFTERPVRLGWLLFCVLLGLAGAWIFGKLSWHLMNLALRGFTHIEPMPSLSDRFDKLRGVLPENSSVRLSEIGFFEAVAMILSLLVSDPVRAARSIAVLLSISAVPLVAIPGAREVVRSLWQHSLPSLIVVLVWLAVGMLTWATIAALISVKAGRHHDESSLYFRHDGVEVRRGANAVLVGWTDLRDISLSGPFVFVWRFNGLLACFPKRLIRLA